MVKYKVNLIFKDASISLNEIITEALKIELASMLNMTCNYYRTYSKYHVCTTHTNNYKVLERVVLDNIREVCKKYLDKNKIKETLNNIEFEGNSLKIKKQIESLEITNNKLTESLDKTYLDRLKGIINEEQFIRVS